MAPQHAQALLIIPYRDRGTAEAAAERARDISPTGSGIVVTDGELGSYLDPSSGDVGNRVVLRGPWVVDSHHLGEIALRCESDAQQASREGVPHD